jgi:hypothetical protein
MQNQAMALDLKLFLNLLPIFCKTVEHFAVSATRWFRWRMVKKSETPSSTVLAAPGQGQGAWVVQTGRCCSLHWVEGGVCLRGGINLGFGTNRHGQSSFKATAQCCCH